MKQATTLVAIIVLLAVGLGFVMGAWSPLIVGVGFNPDTQTSCAVDAEGGGQFPDVPTDAVKRGEIFDKSTLYYSWLHTGASQSLGVAGAFSQCQGSQAIFFRVPTGARYSWEINNGGGLERIVQDELPTGNIPFSGGFTDSPARLAARTVVLDGNTFEDANGKEVAIRDGAVLKVTLEIAVSRDWFNIASDQVQLRSAIPEVRWDREIYEIGDTATVRWRIPVVQIEGTPAYHLSISTMNDAAPVGSWSQVPLSSLTGTASVTVTEGMYDPGNINRLRAEVFSQIVRAGIQDTAVVDDIQKAPQLLSVQITPREPREGDEVTVTIDAAPNVGTGSPIVKYYLLASIDGAVIYDSFSTDNVIKLRASRTGVLTAEASAIDAEGRTSRVARVQATVGNVIVDCEVYPDLPKCKSPLAGIPWALIAAGLVFVLGLLLILPTVRNPRVFAIALGLLAVVAVGVYYVVSVSL